MKASKVKWSTQEDQLLLTMAKDGKNYADMSRLLHNRSTLQIRMHHAVLRGKAEADGRPRSFDLEADWKLIKAIAAKGRAWKAISQDCFDGSRTPSQLLMRWRTLSSLLVVSSDTQMLHQRLKVMHSLSKRKMDKARQTSMEQRLGMLFHSEGKLGGVSAPKAKMSDSPLREPNPDGDFEANRGKIDHTPACPSEIMLRAEGDAYVRPDLPTIVRRTRLDSSIHEKLPAYCLYDDPPIAATPEATTNQYAQAWHNYLNGNKSHSGYWASIFSQRNDLLGGLFGRMHEFATRLHDYSLMQARTSVRLWLCYMKPASGSCVRPSTGFWWMKERASVMEGVMRVA